MTLSYARFCARGSLVILGLVMPEMNGWDFVEQLRTRAEFATVPIIVHTSERLEAHLKRSREGGST